MDDLLWLLTGAFLLAFAQGTWQCLRTPDPYGPALPPAGPEDPALTPAEDVLLASIRRVIAAHEHRDIITANGAQLADACRSAMPAVSDRDILRGLLAQVAVLQVTLNHSDSPSQGLITFADALMGAVTDLCALDEEAVPR